MSNMASRLNQRAELWGKIPFENELGEQDVKDDRIKEIVYCNIIPKSAIKITTPISEGIEFSHKFTVRALSIKEPKLDMFFIHKRLRHNFKSWDPDYKNNEFLEIFTELVME